MKIAIYYQNFGINAHCFGKENIRVYPEHATLVQTMEISQYSTKEQVADVTFSLMNHLQIDRNHPKRSIYESAGHTSMSVGDYIVFEDGTVFICTSTGWLETTRCEICPFVGCRSEENFCDCKYNIANWKKDMVKV